MGKLSLSISDSLLREVGEESEKHGVNRSQVITQATDNWMHKGRSLEEECATLKNQLVETQKSLGSKETELFQQSKKALSMDKQIEELGRKLSTKEEEGRKQEERILTLENQLSEALKAKDQMNTSLQARTDEINFLRGHVSQLTQTLDKLTPALPPSQEEAKKKGWWKFWK